ncbi:adenosine receptor A1-like [Culicoides brevitarsis]|uniref:adenosine receptor A1-like n=1 Tax=Culicoides brevitarsis TaxID=469753 RepID=UPI00307B7639
MEVNKTTGFQTFNVTLNDLQIFVLITELIIGVVTVVGSLVVLALFYHERKSNKNSHRYFTAMAIGDVVYGLTAPSVVIYFSFGITVSDPYCTTIVVLSCIPIFYTLILMLAMSVDRYFAIMKPIEYKSKITKKITYSIIGGCVVFGFLTSGLLFLGLKEPTHPDALCFIFSEYVEMGFNIFILSCLVTPCLCIFVYSYVKIYKVILDAMGTNASHTSKFLELGKIVVRRNTKMNVNEDKMLYGRFKVREIRTTIILFITVVLFLLVWVPGMILSAVLYVVPDYASMEGILLVLALSQLNSMVNPFLFARNIKNADEIIKHWFKRMLCIKTEDFVNSTTPST